MSEFDQKVQNLRTEFINKASDREFLIFDYDGTIATIPLNWADARIECRAFLQRHFPDLVFPDQMRVDEMEAIALTLYPEQAALIFSFRDDLERGVGDLHQPVSVVIEFLKQYILPQKKYRIFIVSNNLKSTIVAGLKVLELDNSFPSILGVDNVGLPKPHLKAIDLLKEDYGLLADRAVMFGDSEATDGVFCRGAGIPFINVNNFI